MKEKIGKKMDFSTSFEWIQFKRYGFENYIVAKIFDALSNDKKVWKEKKKHNSTCYINSFCCTIPKLTKIKNL